MANVDQLDFQIVGTDLQAVIVTLDPGEAVIAEAGSMMFLEDNVNMHTKTSMTEGKSVFGKLLEAGKRAITGEGFFITQFLNEGREKRQAGFAAPYPGRIVALELGDYQGELLCQKDSFLCCARGIEIGIAFTKRLGAGLFGGEGFILQRLKSATGRGQAFVHAGGTVLQRTLRSGETLRVDTGCLVAFETSVDYDIQMVPGIRNKLFGGEGLFYAKLTGPGTVFLQTLPLSRMADRIISASAAQGGGKEEGSLLGGLGRMLDGDNS